MTDLASEVHELEIQFSGQGTVEMAYFANGLSSAYFTKTLTVVNCDETFPITIEPDNPEDEPTHIDATLCEYSDSTATCDDPLGRLETPEIDGGDRP